jgi:hypothetical protein
MCRIYNPIPPQLDLPSALVYAKREFLNHKKYLSPSPAAEGDSEVALLRSGSGVAGVRWATLILRVTEAFWKLLGFSGDTL